MKIGELAGLKVDNIMDSTIHINQYGRTPARDIPLNKAVKKSILEYLKDRPDEEKKDHLFITPNRPPLAY